jgi:hypothetical protein
MNSFGNDYGKTHRSILTQTGSVFTGGTHSRICVRPRYLFLEHVLRFICSGIVTYCTYVTDPLQTLL